MEWRLNIWLYYKATDGISWALRPLGRSRPAIILYHTPGQWSVLYFIFTRERNPKVTENQKKGSKKEDRKKKKKKKTPQIRDISIDSGLQVNMGIEFAQRISAD